MAFVIQRQPRGLADLLGSFGGETPRALAAEAQGVIDMAQFYGRSQVQTLSATDAALAEAGLITITVPSSQHWLLFQTSYVVVKTATMTALRVGLQVDNVTAFSEELGPFGATETGTCSNGIILPYPYLLLPGARVNFRLQILGTDATANCGLTIVAGVLG